MITFTSTLPDDLILLLSNKAKELDIPKNKLIERALRIYLDQINKASYLKSYKQLADDSDVLNIAEEGMEDYISNFGDETR